MFSQQNRSKKIEFHELDIRKQNSESEHKSSHIILLQLYQLELKWINSVTIIMSYSGKYNRQVNTHRRSIETKSR